jgi:hypothetical protein
MKDYVVKYFNENDPNQDLQWAEISGTSGLDVCNQFTDGWTGCIMMAIYEKV